MRLFIALLFNENTKNEICGIRDRLRTVSRAGNFTRDENLHLTLAFLGETERHRIREVEAVLETLQTEPFTLTLSGFGNFGSVYWLGVKAAPALTALYGQLYKGLVAKDFSLEERELRPHITLAREFAPSAAFDRNAFKNSVPSVRQDIHRVSLMKSERVGGRLVYTEIFSREL